MLLLGLVAAAHADAPIRQAGNLGLGLGAGTHVSGLSGKYFFTQRFAGQAVLGWWGVGRGATAGVGVSLDGLWEQAPLMSDETLDIAWNLGAGGSLVTAGGVLGLGAHFVLGLEFDLKPVPLDMVLEYRPGLTILPDLEPDLIGFGAHLRIYPF